MVINHDLPMVAEDYVHRIGRTGRAGAEGLAVSLVSHEESGLLRDIRKLLKQEIAISDVPGFEPSAPLRLDAGAPRPVQGQRQQRPSRPQAHRQQHGAQSHAGERPAEGNRKRQRRRRPAAKA
jgi:ATP-dependent RNA helicase RhlE